uniref:Uncharacterized protein n=1 Tax=Arundo donax TaxID=35708 RepID=A0A0A9FBI4_ARUDO
MSPFNRPTFFPIQYHRPNRCSI